MNVFLITVTGISSNMHMPRTCVLYLDWLQLIVLGVQFFIFICYNHLQAMRSRLTATKNCLSWIVKNLFGRCLPRLDLFIVWRIEICNPS
ncbi:hypothetical protein MRB53_004239 [Persea americana]|uniref:Uncharacterized protein n=1 Tax=Persea americana TaxID=3435 RepID=A0ACC2M9M3_PERAE|nr:hypothetical protein MRB53_004239 [Persea americana]